MDYASKGAEMTLTQCQHGLTDCVSECGADSCIGSGPACGSGQCRCCTDAGCEETSCENNDATTTTTETPVTTTINTTVAAPNNKTSDYPCKTSEKCLQYCKDKDLPSCEDVNDGKFCLPKGKDCDLSLFECKESICKASVDDFEFSFLSRTSRQHHLKFHAMMGLLLAMGTLLLYSK